MIKSLPYIAGRKLTGQRPLARYLPPLGDGVVTTWLESQIPPGGWIIDPFGTSPRLVVEAAQAGYRVLVAVNNPVARFLLEIAASRPERGEFRAALAELASAHRGDERLEPHIRMQYQTNCAACGLPVMADAFLWERGAAAPYSRVYHCPNCGDEGEHTTTESDAKLAAQFASSGIHKARALERVALPNDPDRIHVEEAISHYLPRAVYVLFTIINRLDGLPVSATRKRYLQAMLLHALDMGTTLWGIPSSRPRPRSLFTPPRFRENNIWLALEQAIEVCGEEGAPVQVPLVNWPDVPPPEGGICLFEGRLKDLAGSQAKPRLEAVLTAIPRHNQAFWTLSALWAGWLWGREAVGPFKVVLHRRWYDWAWHTTALTMTLQHLSTMIEQDTPFFGLLCETEPGFVVSALTAADRTGFSLESLAINEDDAQAQVIWKQTANAIPPPSKQTPEILAQNTIQEYLKERGEPASYLMVMSSGIQGIVEQHINWYALNPDEAGVPHQQDIESPKPGVMETSNPHRLYNLMQAALRKAITDRGVFIHINDTDQSPSTGTGEKAQPSDPESGLYWLYENDFSGLPLADRVEIELVRYLSKQTSCLLSELKSFIYTAFPGLLTPSDDLLRVCLDSYAEVVPDKPGYWHLRPQDNPTQRKNDLNQVRGMLTKIGKQLGLLVTETQSPTTQGRTSILWLDQHEQPLYQFHPIASAVIGDIILQTMPLVAKHLIVIPGSRANLVTFKLRRDPRLADKCMPPAGWRFLRFRQIRWLLENPLLSRESLDESLALDPLTFTTPQLRLL